MRLHLIGGLAVVALLAGCGGSTAAGVPSAGSTSPVAAPSASSATGNSGGSAPGSAALASGVASGGGSVNGRASAGSAAGSASVVSVAASGSTSVAAPSGEAMKIPYTQPAAAFAPLWIAQDQGLFRKYGLNTQVLQITPPADVQAVLGGDSVIGVDGSLVINAIASGGPLTFVAVPVPYFAQSIYANPSIKTVKDLQGKTVAATGQGGSSDNALRTELAKEGVDPAKLNIVYLRDDSAILAALQGHSVDAAVLTSPNTLRAKQAGLLELAYLPAMKLLTVNNGIYVRKDWAAQHRDVVQGFLKAYLEGIKTSLTDPAAAKAAIAKWAKIDDPALLDESYKTNQGLWAAFPLATDAEFQNVQELAPDPKVKAAKPSDFYDNSYLTGLQDFAKSLYPQGIPS